MPNLKPLAEIVARNVKDHVARSITPLVVRMDGIDSRVAAIPAGPKGDKGEAGFGLLGPKGDKGDPGESVKGEKGDPGERGKDGRDGEDINMKAVLEMVQTAVAGLPPAKDGKDGTDGQSIKGDKGDAGEHGKDAAELAIGPSIDEAKSYRRGTWASHNGGLIRAARQTDPVKDGDLVKAGWVVMVEGLAAVVVSQGENERNISVSALLTSGTKAVCEFTMPVQINRGVWREGEYERGDLATWAGSQWHCEAVKSTRKPDDGSGDWKLVVKRGANGKDGMPGKEGRPGKDAQK